MAFLQHSKQFGETPAFEHRLLMTDSEGCTLGEALVLSSGRLTKCGATATPQYIAQATIASASSSTEYVPVVPVVPQQEFETTVNADASSLNVGDKVTLHTDGLVVTATTSSGVFQLTYIGGTAANSTVRGRFPAA